MDDIKKRILALMAKTTENGCTEQEAILASQKVQELLNKHQLSISDLKLKEESNVRHGEYNTRVKSQTALHHCLSDIGYFTDCKVWFSTASASMVYKYFGLDHDVMIAEYITKVIDWALIYGGEDFKDDPTYQMTPKSGRSKILLDFRNGMALRIAQKLRTMKDEQSKVNIASTGRDLVIVKSNIVAAEWDKQGIRLSKARASTMNIRSADAYNAGARAGDNFNLNAGIKGHEPKGSIEHG